MKKNNKNIIVKYLISSILMVLLFANFTNAAKLKKGIYRITNHREGRSQMFVDENGKILLKSDANSQIAIAEDLVTRENKLLYKINKKMYQESHDTYNVHDYYAGRTYTGLIENNIECFDLTGKSLNFDKKFIAVINDNVIFEDGSCYNLALNVKTELKELVENNTNSKYSLINTSNFFIFKRTVINSDYHGDLYIYDRKLNFKKVFKECSMTESIINVGDLNFNTSVTRNYIIISKKQQDDYYYNLLDMDLNLIFDEWDYDISVVDANSVKVYYKNDSGNIVWKNYNVLTKEYTDVDTNSKNRVPKFNNDRGNLTSTITDGKKDIVINDIEIKKCIAFELGDKTYYYVFTTNNKSYIYNENGDRVKILKEKTDKEYKLVYSDERILALLANERMLYVYDKDFNLKRTIGVAKDCSISKMFNGKYYAVYLGNALKSDMVFDADFNEKYFAPVKVTFKTLLDKYYYETGANSRIIDENFKSVKVFENNVNNIQTLKVRDKIYLIVIYTDDKCDILDTHLNKVSSLDYSFFPNFEMIFVNGIDLKVRDNANFIYTEKKVDSKSVICIYDLNFKMLAKLEIEENSNTNDYGYGDYETDSDGKSYDLSTVWSYGDYLVIRRPHDYSLYKVGTGYILKNFYYIGDLESDHFTYVNGFNYGFMDYDLNILSHYSVFDSFNNDKYGDFFFY